MNCTLTDISAFLLEAGIWTEALEITGDRCTFKSQLLFEFFSYLAFKTLSKQKILRLNEMKKMQS